jgi:hypothetical protein
MDDIGGSYQAGTLAVLCLTSLIPSLLSLGLTLIRTTREIGRWIGIFSLGWGGVVVLASFQLQGQSYFHPNLPWTAWCAVLAPLALSAAGIVLASRHGRRARK